MNSGLFHPTKAESPLPTPPNLTKTTKTPLLQKFLNLSSPPIRSNTIWIDGLVESTKVCLDGNSSGKSLKDLNGPWIDPKPDVELYKDCLKRRG